MLRTTKVICLFIFSFSYLYDYNLACQCLRSSDEQMFCKARFVLHAIVVEKQHFFLKNNDKVVDSFFEYTVDPIKIYKGNGFITSHINLNHINITTPVDDGLCGLRLKENTEYLLSGHEHNAKPYSNLCDWIKEWSQVSESLKEKLEAGNWTCTA